MKYLFFFSRFAAFWMDTWALFPIALTVWLAVFPSMAPYAFAGILMGAYVLGLVLRSLLIRKNRLPTLAVSLAACIGLGLLLGTGIGSVIGIVLLSFAAVCRGILVAEQPLRNVFPRAYCFTALIIYFFAWLLYGRMIALKEYQSYILYAGLIAIPSILYLINSDVLMQASRAELKESSSMPVVKRNNRIIMAITLIAGILIAGYNTLKDAFVNALKTAFLFLIGILDRLMNLLYSPMQGGETPGEGQTPQLPPAEPAKSSPFWDMVVMIIGYLIAAALLIGFLILLVRMLIKLFRRLAELLKRWMSEGGRPDEAYGYSDEKENLIDWQSIRHSYAEGIKDWIERTFRNEPKWSQLTDNRQKIRYLYRHLILRSIAAGYAFRASRTPDETIRDLAEHDKLGKDLQPVLKRLYGIARYGNGTIQDSEVETLKRDLKI